MSAPNHIVRTHRDVVTVTLPLKLTNPLNGSHSHWSSTGPRRRQRDTVALVMRGRLADLRRETGDVVVTVTRIAPSSGLDPHDALPASAKGIVDGVADALGINDRSPLVTWQYAQERGRPKEYAVRIRVESVAR